MNVNLPMVLAHLLLLAIVLQQVPIALSAEPVQKAPAEVEAALSRAGKNRPALEKALKNAPAEQHQGMEFLIANMPDADLQSLSADFLLENVALAYRAKKQFAWGAKFSDEIFFNNVLPYANVDEVRDPWRKELYDLCMPLVKDCKTSSEAVHILNSKLFEKLKVRYSTQRRKPQQSPKESIETGMASCTGLSILLSDACRSVAIPTRVVGTPLWANKRGNHTWLEIWDGRLASRALANPIRKDSITAGLWATPDRPRKTRRNMPSMRRVSGRPKSSFRWFGLRAKKRSSPKISPNGTRAQNRPMTSKFSKTKPFVFSLPVRKNRRNGHSMPISMRC